MTVKSKILGLISTIVVIALLIYFLSDPYVFTSAKAAYELGTEEMKDGRDYDVIHPGRLRQATKYFQLAIDKGYKDKEIYSNAYWCYAMLNENAKSEDVLSQGIELYPSEIEFYFRRGEMRKEMKKHQLALDDFNSAVQLDSGKYEYLYSVHYDRGAMKYILGDSLGSMKDWHSASKIAPHELRSYSDYCRLWK
jgi:tetratricopeptide (TPR) repeat protein